MVSLEFSGKTVKAAIEEGLKALGKSLDEVQVNIVNQGGFLKKAKVMISYEGTASQGDSDSDVAQKVVKDLNLTPKPPRQREKQDYSNAPGNAYDEEKAPRDDDNKIQQTRKDVPSRKEFQRNQGRDKNRNQEKRNGSHKRCLTEGDAGGRERAERIGTPVTEDVAQRAEDFLKGLLGRMDVESALERTIDEGCLKFAVTCDSGIVIGYRGETLDAIEYLTSLSVNKSDDVYYRVSVDCNGYKQKREETLGNLARRMAAKAVKSRRKVVMEPMSSSSRKIIHSVLSSDNAVITRSEGHDPARRVVIIPKR